jgi:uncharacterized protein (TIGR04222 family)
MFPFNLPGPEFLLFFLAFWLAMVGAAVLWRRAHEVGPIPKLTTLDPYVLAYLRGSENETIRTAVVSLVDRGLLTADGIDVRCSRLADPALARRPIEQAVLSRCATSVEGPKLLGEPALTAACRPFRDELIAAGLLANAEVMARRRRAAVAFLLAYLAVAGIKVSIGLGRGRPVSLLVVFALLGAIVVGYACLRPVRTRVGDLFLADVQTFLGPLKARAASLRPGGADADVALLVGAFGVAALPAATFASVRDLYPKAAAGNAGGSSCGGACGSSCGGGGDGGGGYGGCGGD